MKFIKADEQRQYIFCKNKTSVVKFLQQKFPKSFVGISLQVRNTGSPTYMSLHHYEAMPPLRSPPPAHIGGVPYSLDPSKGEPSGGRIYTVKF